MQRRCGANAANPPLKLGTIKSSEGYKKITEAWQSVLAGRVECGSALTE